MSTCTGMRQHNVTLRDLHEIGLYASLTDLFTDKPEPWLAKCNCIECQLDEQIINNYITHLEEVSS